MMQPRHDAAVPPEVPADADDPESMYATAPIGLAVLDTDLRYLRVNDKLAELSGQPAASLVGRRLAEVVPDLAEQAARTMRRVAAGESVWGTEFVGTSPARPGVQRVWRENWLPVRDATGSVVGATISVEEITESRRTERRRAYLLDLAERLRDQPDARAVIDAGSAALGRYLGIAQVGLGEVDPTEQFVRVRSDWSDGRLGSVVGTWRMDDFGPDLITALRAGRTQAVDDVRNDPRTNSPAQLAAHDAIGTRAVLQIPLLINGRMAALLFVHATEPRVWSADDLAVAEATGQRLWTAFERARAESLLREGDERQRLLVAALAEVVWQTDAEARSAPSPAWAALTGLALEATAGHGWLRAIHADDRAALRERFERARALPGASLSAEYRIRCADGAWRWFESRGTARVDADGTVAEWIGVSIDIDERKRAEQALIARSAEIESLLVSAPLGIAYFDREHRWLRINDTLAAVNGIAAGEHVGRRIEKLLPEVAASVGPLIDRVFATGEVVTAFEINGETPRAPGVRRHWLTSYYPVRHGDDVASVGVWVIDITERKASENALAESEARFRTLAATMPALMFVADAQGENVYTNPQLQAFTGLEAPALLGRGWLGVIHPDDRERAALTWDRSWRAGEPAAAEYRFRDAAGAYRSFLCRWNPVRDEAGTIAQWVGTGTDVQEMTEVREALAASRIAIEQANATLEQRVQRRTEALRLANAQLEQEIRRRESAQAALAQSQKLEALGQLTSGIAHDFNNVIAAISGGFSVIERRTDDPRLIKIAQHGVNAARRGAGLVRQLLAFARQQVLEPAIVDLRHLLDESRPLLQRSVGAGVALEIDCPADVPMVRIDAVQLETALLNLAVNARDAMPDGGHLRITVRDCPLEAPDRPAELAGVAAVEIEVADSGCGMAPEVLQRVFEPFFTTKGPGKGTGLGMAMVHGFALQSGGALRIESRPGAGTTVAIYLPQALAVPAAPGVVERRVEPQRSARLLLVDDDDALRGVTAAQLADLGHDVVETRDGAAALDALDDDATIELMLTDLAMPGIDGIELARRARARRPGLPIAFMSGLVDRRRLADEVVLEKPFDAEELARRIAALLREADERRDAEASLERLHARLRSEPARALLRRWRDAATGGALPAFADFHPDAVDQPHRLVIAEVDLGRVPIAFRFVHIGGALAQALGRPLGERELAATGDDSLGRWEAAYRRCARIARPCYEFMRADFGDGTPASFERLLLPWSANGDGVDRIVALVVVAATAGAATGT